MMRLFKFLIVPALALVLAACGDPDTETAPPPEPERPTDPVAAPERAEPAEPPPPDMEADPEAELEALTEARAERERFRTARRQPEHWWDDDTFVEELGLDPDQRASLLEVREALHEARLEGRTRLRELRGEARALEGDEERLAELQTSIGEVRERLDAAEGRWQDTVRSTLRPEQLEQLEDLMESPP